MKLGFAKPESLPSDGTYLTDGRRLVEVVDATPKRMKVRNVSTECFFEIEFGDFGLWRAVTAKKK